MYVVRNQNNVKVFFFFCYFSRERNAKGWTCLSQSLLRHISSAGRSRTTISMCKSISSRKGKHKGIFRLISTIIITTYMKFLSSLSYYFLKFTDMLIFMPQNLKRNKALFINIYIYIYIYIYMCVCVCVHTHIYQ